jgi:non-specific serine/threonine protein kinase
VGESARISAVGDLHNFPVVPTSFIGRADAMSEVSGLLERYQLVTVTGPGGAGKTRLASELARQVAARFEDGAWLVELAAVRDPDQIPAAVAVALGINEQPGEAITATLARVLARQQLLLVLDNCEHVISTAAALCAELVAACDELRILATSREALRVAGETRYRLAPLAVPDSDELAEAAGSEALALFADRARQADARFALDGQTGPMAARLVTRLDGMPLAIELAAARVEALGLTQLLDRLDDRFALLASGDRLAPSRQQSLAAAVEWSYQLLSEREQRVFRAVSVFPGPFTLDGAEAVAGQDARLAVLRLVDCSLLAPPRTDGDGRSRYLMLETLRAYGARLQAEASEQHTTASALAGYALRVAEEAEAALQTSTAELAAAQRLDAEEPLMRQVLAWAAAHDASVAVRLADALGTWWWLRSRLAGQYPLLRDIAGLAEHGSDAWCAIQWRLGWAAMAAGDQTSVLGYFTAARDAAQPRGLSRVLADALAGLSVMLPNMGQLAEGAEQGRRALAMARELNHLPAMGAALDGLAIAAFYTGDYDGSVQLVRQAQQITGMPGWEVLGGVNIMVAALLEAGDLVAAEDACTAAAAACRETGHVMALPQLLELIAEINVEAGRFQDAATHLREGLQIALRTGNRFGAADGLWACAMMCSGTGRHADSVTLLSFIDVYDREQGFTSVSPREARGTEEALSQARQALGADRLRAAEVRGAGMSLDTVAEYALMLAGPPPSGPAAAPELGKLSARERELVTLVAQGHTNAQIAAQLFISVRTVGSHLDRIRDKTGCRRRADLTRLALTAGLV